MNFVIKIASTGSTGKYWKPNILFALPHWDTLSIRELRLAIKLNSG